MMLIISNRQLAVLQRHRTEAFAVVLLGELRADNPAHPALAERPGLLVAVLGYLDTALSCGLSTARELRAYVALHLFVAEGWDEFPPIAGMLRTSAGTVGTSFDRIVRLLDEEDWQGVKAWREMRT
jgi:hypothetical protein